MLGSVNTQKNAISNPSSKICLEQRIREELKKLHESKIKKNIINMEKCGQTYY